MKNDFFYSYIYSGSEWIIRFVLANLLWLVLNIPLIFVIINLLYANQIQTILIWGFAFFIAAPFTLFPTTQAVFSLARDWILNKANSNVFKVYWNYYKENYKKSFMGGFILSFIWFIWTVDFLYFSQNNLYLLILFTITGSFLYVYNINYFSISAHYDMSFHQILKKTLLVTITSPTLFLVVLFSNTLLVLISLFLISFLSVFLLVSLIAFVSFYAFYKRYLTLLKGL